MKHNLPYILNLPPFTYRGINFQKKSIFYKLFFILRGKIIGFIINTFSNKLFCFFINMFFPKKQKFILKMDSTKKI